MEESICAWGSWATPTISRAYNNHNLSESYGSLCLDGLVRLLANASVFHLTEVTSVLA